MPALYAALSGRPITALVSRVRGNSDGAAWTGIPQRERRSAKQQLVGVRTAFCRPEGTSFLILSLEHHCQVAQKQLFLPQSEIDGQPGVGIGALYRVGEHFDRK